MPYQGYVEDPDYDDDYLFETVGYCTRVWVEQEGDRDSVRFMLRIYTDPVGGASGVLSPQEGAGIGLAGGGRSGAAEPDHRNQTFKVYLDVNTSVAFAQLQIARDALNSVVLFFGEKVGIPLLVRVRFNFESADICLAYWVGALHIDDEDYPLTATRYYERFHDAPMFMGTWYTHLW